jgi:hypothetical protein
MTFDSRLSNTVTNLAAAVPRRFHGHPCVNTRTPGRTRVAQERRKLWKQRACWQVTGDDSRVLLHARWPTNHCELLQPMFPDDLRAHFAAQAPTEIPSWFQPAMEHLSVPSLPGRTSDDKQDNAAVKVWSDQKNQANLQREQCERRSGSASFRR